MAPRNQKKSAWWHYTGKFQHNVASPKTRMSQDNSSHAKESISSLESLQKASEWAHGHVISPTHKRTEGRAPEWGSELTSKDAALQGDPAKTAAS